MKIPLENALRSRHQQEIEYLNSKILNLKTQLNELHVRIAAETDQQKVQTMTYDSMSLTEEFIMFESTSKHFNCTLCIWAEDIIKMSTVPVAYIIRGLLYIAKHISVDLSTVRLYQDHIYQDILVRWIVDRTPDRFYKSNDMYAIVTGVSQTNDYALDMIMKKTAFIAHILPRMLEPRNNPLFQMSTRMLGKFIEQRHFHVRRQYMLLFRYYRSRGMIGNLMFLMEQQDFNFSFVNSMKYLIKKEDDTSIFYLAKNLSNDKFHWNCDNGFIIRYFFTSINRLKFFHELISQPTFTTNPRFYEIVDEECAILLDKITRANYREVELTDLLYMDWYMYYTFLNYYIVARRRQGVLMPERTFCEWKKFEKKTMKLVMSLGQRWFKSLGGI
jgi:hypothetical protein